MDTKIEKKIRLSMMMHVLEGISPFCESLFLDNSFTIWCNEIKRRISNDFDKAYDEVNDFMNDNKDIILLLLTSLNQCHGGISSELEKRMLNRYWEYR